MAAEHEERARRDRQLARDMHFAIRASIVDALAPVFSKSADAAEAAEARLASIEDRLTRIEQRHGGYAVSIDENGRITGIVKNG